MDSISYWIGTIGGLAGLLSMLVTGLFWLKNRRSHLYLFTPYNWSGSIPNGHRVYHFVLWFINHSKMPANLFLDTMGISIKRKGQHNFVQVPLLPPPTEALMTDFPQHEQHRLGVNKVPYFNQFEKMLVTMEKPLLGYICFPSEDLNNDSPISDIHIEIRDQFFKKHSLKINLEKQRKAFAPPPNQFQENKS